MPDAKAFTSLDGPPILPLRLRHRGQARPVPFITHTLACFKPTSLSFTAKGTKEEPQGTASSREHAQHKSRRCVCAQDNQSYSHVKTCLAPGGREVWASCTGHYPPRPPRWPPFGPLTKGPWGPKNGDCHLVVAGVLADGDVLGVGNHMLPRWIQVCGTV